MFSFLLENYIAAKNMKEQESEMGFDVGAPSRQSDYIMNKFTTNAGITSSVDLSWSRATMTSQLDPI